MEKRALNQRKEGKCAKGEGNKVSVFPSKEGRGHSTLLFTMFTQHRIVV